MTDTTKPVLTVDHATVVYESDDGLACAVNDISFTVAPGQILGIVGESGCGKSTLAYAIMHLLPANAALVEGKIQVQGVNVYRLTEDELRRFRWQHVSMVFQSALVTLNPVLTVGHQFREIFRIHAPALSRGAVGERIEELLELVRIHPQHLRSYPHELSGGMRQRIAIAMAIALDPDLVIMDEPTTALDAVVQREILEEIRRIQAIKHFAVVFISHDLRLIRYISSAVMVMYAGRAVETGSADRFLHPAAHHPYTRGLLDSLPEWNVDRFQMRGIPGSPPDLAHPISGCAFRPRCPIARSECSLAPPTLRDVGAGKIACIDVQSLAKGNEAHG